ncbi:MAG: protein kinase domain-containing protein, partial [Anaerolineales bacterium]
LGQHLSLNRSVAVKLLYGHLVTDPGSLKRFREEARAVAALRHPHIVQVHDFDVVDGRPFIVMEYIEGVSLAEVMQQAHQRRTRLSFADVLRLLGQVASALDYAHDKGIIHRDVKPSNVMLRGTRSALLAGASLPPDTHSVLTDFGVARVANATSHTASGTLLGTPAYMSPEQIRGLPLDARTDVYSLACLVYELVTGRLPFDPEDDSVASILFKQAYEPPPPLPPEYAGLQAILDRGLAKEAESRYERPGQLAEDLSRALNKGEAHLKTARLLPPTSKPARTVARARRKADRRIWAVLAAALLFCGAVGSIVAISRLLPLGTGAPGDAATETTGISMVMTDSTAGATGTQLTEASVLASSSGTPASQPAATQTGGAPASTTQAPAASSTAMPSPTRTPTPSPTKTAVPTATKPPTATAPPPTATSIIDPIVTLLPTIDLFP